MIHHRCDYGNCLRTAIEHSRFCKDHSKKKFQKNIKPRGFNHTFSIGKSQFTPEPIKEINYQEYIISEEWKEKSIEEKKKNPRCSLCNRKTILNVHHRTYVRLGQEIPGDLIVLCDECHDIFHQFYEYNSHTGIFLRKN